MARMTLREWRWYVAQRHAHYLSDAPRMVGRAGRERTEWTQRHIVKWEARALPAHVRTWEVRFSSRVYMLPVSLHTLKGVCGGELMVLPCCMLLDESSTVENSTLRTRWQRGTASRIAGRMPAERPIKRRDSNFGPEGLRESPGGCETIPLFRAKSAKRPDPRARAFGRFS